MTIKIKTGRSFAADIFYDQSDTVACQDLQLVLQEQTMLSKKNVIVQTF